MGVVNLEGVASRSEQLAALKARTIDQIIATERGYVDDPSDSGGATKYGITERVARKHGYDGDMRDLPRALAVDIYAAEYWDALALDEIGYFSVAVAQELADTGVNMGTGRAAVFLQRCLNAFNRQGSDYPDIAVDGDVGPGTLKAFLAFLDRRGAEGIRVLVNALNCLQGAGYIELAERRSKDERFVYGWMRTRVSIDGTGE